MTVALIICGLDWNMLCYAKDELKEVRINAVINSIPQRLEALQDKDGILYLSTDVLSNITVYQYDSESMRFVHDASDGSMNYREIWTFAEEGIQIVNFSRGMISIQKEIAIPARPEYNGKRYFPLAELLPALNANVLIRDGYLYVEEVENSLTNIFATLDIDEYLFDLYDDNDFLWFSDAEILSGWSYLFMTAVRLDLSRMAHIGGFDRFGTISLNTAQIEDYEEIFTSFLSEDTAYLQSVGEENKQYLPLVTYLSSDDYEEEQIRQSAISAIAEYSERLHKKEIEKYPAMAYYCSEYDLISSLDKISTYANNALQIYSYAALYVDHVADHYQMLETVYSSEWERTFLEKLNEKDKSILGSKNVYNRFSENLITSLSSYVVDQSWDMLLDEAMEYNLFTGPKIAASLIELNLDSYDVYLYEIAKDCQYLGHYNQLMERGYSRYLDLYHGSAGMSYDTMEDARLAAIFTLLTSRSSYQAMHDAVLAMEDGKTLYEDEIAEIDRILEKLYLAKYCCLTDSEEYIDERIEMLNSTIDTITVFDKNLYDSSEVENLQIYARYFYTHFNEENASVFLTDLTHDGVAEMTVVSRELYEEQNVLNHSDIFVYQLINDSLYLIYENFTGSAHVGNKGLSLTNINGNDYLIEYAPLIYGGDAVYSGVVFSLNGIDNSVNEYYNANIDHFVFDESRYDYDFNKKSEGINKFESFLKEYLPNSKTLSNNSKVKISDYDSNADDLFTISKASDVFQNVSTYFMDFSKIKIDATGEVHSLNGVLLREGPSEDFPQLTMIPNHTQINVIGAEKDFQKIDKVDKWLYIEYQSQKGYVPSDCITIEFTKPYETLSESDMLIMGILLREQYERHLDLFSYNWGLLDCTPTNDIYQDMYVRLEPKYSLDDLKNQYNNYYSSKYNLTNLEETHKEIDGYLYYLAPGRGSDVWLESSEVYDIKSISADENEITFYNCLFLTMGTWTQNESMRLKEFSIVYEDGKWKCGKIYKGMQNITTDYYSNLGIVSTESTALNLRAYDSIHADIITKIPRNSIVTILDSTLLLSMCSEGKWYLVDYKGQVGYVSADYIQITEEKVKLTEKQLINIAQLRYYEGLNAKEWEMSSCFELDRNNTFNESEFTYILLKNIHSIDDWLEQVHTLFSEKYGDYYKCDEIIHDKITYYDSEYPKYLEKDKNWYICDGLYRHGNLPVDILSVDKHNIIEFEVESINENEVVFRGVINWDESYHEYSEKQEIISEFSIVYEDGYWKCGKLPI